MTHRVLLLFGAAALLSGCGTRTGQISGFVQDNTGAAIPNAAVDAKIGSASRSTTSGGDGAFEFDDLKDFGVYTLTGTKGDLKGTTHVLLDQAGWAAPPGFRTTRAENIVIILIGTGGAGWFRGTISPSLSYVTRDNIAVTVDGVSGITSTTDGLGQYAVGPIGAPGTYTIRAVKSIYAKTVSASMPAAPSGSTMPTITIDFTFP